jgi:hypothetical protein
VSVIKIFDDDICTKNDGAAQRISRFRVPFPMRCTGAEPELCGLD